MAPVTKPEPITQSYIYSQPLLIVILKNNGYAHNRNLVPRYYFSLSNQRLARGTIVQVVENPAGYVMMKAAGEIDRAIGATRAKARELDRFRRQSKAALDSLAEVNKLLEPPAFLSSLELMRDSITVSGNAEHAEPLLKLFDNSPQFQGSEFTIPLTPSANMQLFSIRAARRPQ